MRRKRSGTSRCITCRTRPICQDFSLAWFGLATWSLRWERETSGDSVRSLSSSCGRRNSNGARTPSGMEDQATHRSWRSWIGITGTIVLLLGIVGLLTVAQSWKQDLRVRSVTVVGLNIVPASEIVSLAGITKGQKLFAVDLGSVRRNVQQHPFVRLASVERDAPDRIIITIDEREPVAAIMADRMLYLDSEATVLPAVHS